LETPRNALKTITKAARRSDLDRFLECLDLDYLKEKISEVPGGSDVRTEEIASFIKDSPNLRQTFELMMGVHASHYYEVLEEKRTAVKARKLVVRAVGKDGLEFRAEWLFIHQDGKWKLDPEGTY
jgi:hypothetical protein